MSILCGGCIRVSQNNFLTITAVPRTANQPLVATSPTSEVQEDCSLFLCCFLPRIDCVWICHPQPYPEGKAIPDS